MADEQAPPAVRVEVLGPLRLVVDDQVVDVRGTKRRAVLVLLALAEGSTVTVDRLLDALDPSEVSGSGRQALYSHVFRLRAHLGPAASRLERRPEGYRLVLDDDSLDVTRARALLATARAEHDATAALALLRQARALWRGPALADLSDLTAIAGAVEGFAQLHREVTDALVDRALEAGEAPEVLSLAVESLGSDPLREPAVLLLMRALAATGQAAEALGTGRDYRHRLAEETGLDPSPALGRLERDIATGTAGPEVRPHAVRPGPPVTPTVKLFGREAQVGALHRLLATERLVTLVGPGGVGKTRVALEVARETQGAVVLMLAPVTHPDALPHALASALNLKVEGDVLAACIDILRESPSQLVVDNCEHLLDAVRALVDRLLTSCPQLSVLATSREPLGLPLEHTSRLAPLMLPHHHQDLAAVPSVGLFVERAGRVRPGRSPTPAELHTIADIVRRLDGMPLAIELAASRLSTFSLAELRDRLDRSLDLLGGSRAGDPRHRTLRATVDWSYQLLSDDERRLFRHLSVFVDGVDLESAEQVATDLKLESDPGSVLARLVDASMVEPDFDGPRTRYRMLETLRAFGLDELTAAGEQVAAAGRLRRWAVDLTASIGAALVTDGEPGADAVLRAEIANLRAAWRQSRAVGSLDESTAMVTALFDAVAYRDLIELRQWAEELADDPALVDHPHAAQALGVAAEAAYHRGDYTRADRLARLGLGRTTDESRSWYCLIPLAVVALARGSLTEVVELSLEAAAGPRPSESLGLAALATAYAGDNEEARTLNQRAIDVVGSPTMRSWTNYVAGEIESRAGRGELAERHYVRAIELARGSGATFLVGVASVGLLSLRAESGRIRDSLDGYREVIDYFDRTGDWTHQWVTLRNLADLLRRLGDPVPAALLDAAANRAPDAPAVGPDRATDAAPRPSDDTPLPNRAEVLAMARDAIDRNLAGL